MSLSCCLVVPGISSHLQGTLSLSVWRSCPQTRHCGHTAQSALDPESASTPLRTACLKTQEQELPPPRVPAMPPEYRAQSLRWPALPVPLQTPLSDDSDITPYLNPSPAPRFGIVEPHTPFFFFLPPMPPGFPVAECLVPLVALAEGDEGAGGRGDQDRGGVTVLLRRNLSKPLGSPGYEKHWLGVLVGSSSQHTPCSHPWIAQASRRRCGCCCCRRPLITRPSRPRHPVVLPPSASTVSRSNSVRWKCRLFSFFSLLPFVPFSGPGLLYVYTACRPPLLWIYFTLTVWNHLFSIRLSAPAEPSSFSTTYRPLPNPCPTC